MTTGYASLVHAAIPFTLAGNLVYLTARVGRSRPLVLLLETGAGMSALDRRAARELGLASVGTFQAQGAGGDAVAMELARMPEMTLGDVTLPASDVGLHDFLALHRQTGRRFDGLLAFQALKDFVVEIDFPARTLRLHDPVRFAYRGPGVTLDYRVDLGLIHVPATLAAGGVEVAADLVLDTGAGGRAALVLASPFCRAHGWPLEGSAPVVLETAGHGLAGAAGGAIGRIDALHLGGLALEHPVTLFSSDTRGFLSWPGRAGVLGMEALRRGRLYLDDARRRLVIEPTASWSMPFEYDGSGLQLECDEALDQVRVRSVTPDSPAAASGLHAGDRVLAVNGQPARAIPLHRLRAMLTGDGRRYVLSVARDGAIHDVLVATRRLV